MANIKARNVKPVVVSGHEFPMHSDYMFELQKVYATDNERSLDFAIRVFSQKGFVPYFTVTYACLPMEKYEEMMELIAPDEMPVQYYDSTNGEYRTAYFYAQQPTYDQILALQGEHKFVLGVSITFAGTLRENVENTESNIVFYGNGGNGYALVSGNIGQDVYLNDGTVVNGETDTEFSRAGYALSHWNTEPDGSGRSYALGAHVCMRENSKILYAQWKQTI